jgi:membrane protease YdiL (CAAX protease family)
MLLVDHLLFAVIAFVHPIVGYISWQRLMRRIAAGETVNRPQLYSMTMAGHWTLFAVTLVLWVGAGRGWTELGFGLTRDAWFAAGVLLAVLAVILLVFQLRYVRKMPRDELLEARDGLGSVAILIPRNGNELGRFYGLSVTAGIVEETLWRGFMIWYLAHVMPIWLAGLVSALAFGIAHLYQGAANLPRISMVGVVFAALYLMTGSLWVPMVVHALVDIIQGRIGYEVMTIQNEPPPKDGAFAENGAT